MIDKGPLKGFRKFGDESSSASQSSNTSREDNSTNFPIREETADQYCHTCGSSNPESNIYCNECGNLLIPQKTISVENVRFPYEEQSKTFCQHCGVESTGKNHYCTACGRALQFPFENDYISKSTSKKYVEKIPIFKMPKTRIIGLVTIIIAVLLGISSLFKHSGIAPNTPLDDPSNFGSPVEVEKDQAIPATQSVNLEKTLIHEPSPTSVPDFKQNEQINIQMNSTGRESINSENAKRVVVLYSIKDLSFLLREVAFSPDGKYLVSATMGQIQIWRALDGEALGALETDNDPFDTIAFSPEDNLLAVGSISGVVQVWDIDDRSLHFSVMVDRPPDCLGFSPDGSKLAIGTDKGVIEIWDINGKEKQFSITADSGAITSLAFSPDGKWLAIGSNSSLIKIWRVSDGYLEASFRDHSMAVNSVSFSPDSKLLASTSFDGTVRIRGIPGGKSIHTIEAGVDHFFSVKFSPDGRIIAASADDDIVYLWDVSNGKPVIGLMEHYGGFGSIAFHPDGSLIASAFDKNIYVWGIKDEK